MFNFSHFSFFLSLTKSKPRTKPTQKKISTELWINYVKFFQSIICISQDYPEERSCWVLPTRFWARLWTRWATCLLPQCQDSLGCLPLRARPATGWLWSPHNDDGYLDPKSSFKKYPKDTKNFMLGVAYPALRDAMDKIGYLPPADNVRMAKNLYIAGSTDNSHFKLSLSRSKAAELSTKGTAQVCKIMNIIKYTFQLLY